jgi:hypothetical protein
MRDVLTGEDSNTTLSTINIWARTESTLISRRESKCYAYKTWQAKPSSGPFSFSSDIPHFTHSIFLYSTFQILFYALRPGFIRSQKPTPYHFLSIIIQLAFDLVLYLWLGPNALIYLIMSSFFAGSLHPCAAHFIAEHYLWDGLDQETYSYYGPLNILAYNASPFPLLFFLRH